MSAEAAPRRWTVSIGGRLPLPNLLYAMSLRGRLRTKHLWRGWTVAALKASGVPALGRARVTFVRHSAGTPDGDAIPAAFKWVRDALIVAGVVDNDDGAHLGATYRAERCARGAARVELVIEDWTGDAMAS